MEQEKKEWGQIVFERINGTLHRVGYISYSELEELAAADGCNPNRVAVGLWAKRNGYLKARYQIHYKVYLYYRKYNNAMC